MYDIRKYLRQVGITDACGNLDIYGRSRNNTRRKDPAPDWKLALAGNEEPAVLDI